MKAQIKTSLPGNKSEKVIARLKKHNVGHSSPYPLVFSGEGQGVYVKDIDGNTFLDFASNIASTPLGYNHPRLKQVIKHYAKFSPVKYAGQDFNVKEHADLIEALISTTKGMDGAFLVNSGAEAVENVIKMAMRARPQAKVGISFRNAFHGRTLGALSLTNSKRVHKKGFLSIPVRRLPYTDEAAEVLLGILEREHAPSEIAFVILEHLQGEGGYNLAPQRMVKEIRHVCKAQQIPYIADEVQAGMGRTGKWWAFEHYNIKPDLFSSAKALQVGAAVATKPFFPKAEGTLSSTWGGGHLIDLAVGLETIKTIKRDKLLSKNKRHGEYMLKRLAELSGELPQISHIRGRGLMCAFDLPSPTMRDNVIIEALQKGLILLGCGRKSIRLIPPFIITEKELDEGLHILAQAIQKCSGPRFKHKGKICNFLNCGRQVT